MRKKIFLAVCIVILLPIVVVMAIAIFSFQAHKNEWKPITTYGAPEPRSGHIAIWTGKEMIIWGGKNSYRFFNNGARYYPDQDIWTSMTTIGAPHYGDGDSAIWTGHEMIIWGGKSGGKYEPYFDIWRPVTTVGAPELRQYHWAGWTGSKMIIWGGVNENKPESSFSMLNTGGIYDPEEDKWTSMTTEGSPLLKRFSGGRVLWAKDRLIVCGKTHNKDNLNEKMNEGALYDPEKDKWSPMSTKDMPEDIILAVWNGKKMLVFNGPYLEASYDPDKNEWEKNTNPKRENDVISVRLDWVDQILKFGGKVAIWTGDEDNESPGKVLIWEPFGGGNVSIFDVLYGRLITGWVYDLGSGKYTNIIRWNAPSQRFDPSVVWTGKSMIIWGGAYFTANQVKMAGMHSPKLEFFLNTGGIYTPPNSEDASPPKKDKGVKH